MTEEKTYKELIGLRRLCNLFIIIPLPLLSIIYLVFVVYRAFSKESLLILRLNVFNTDINFI